MSPQAPWPGLSAVLLLHGPTGPERSRSRATARWCPTRPACSICPRGFSYRVFSREGDPLTRRRPRAGRPRRHGRVLGRASWAPGWCATTRSTRDDVAEDGLVAGGARARRDLRPRRRRRHHDPAGRPRRPPARPPGQPGGHGRQLRRRPHALGHLADLRGDDSILGKPHGYVFEVDPWRGGNPEPIRAMGRFEHEAVAFDRRGRAYLTEDAGGPHGCFYRFLPRTPAARARQPARGRRAGGDGGGRRQQRPVDRADARAPCCRSRWVDVPNADPGDDDTPVREQVIAAGATPIMKAEGVWTGADGSIWFVSSRGDGPDAEDEEDRSAAVHAGQIWRYDPQLETHRAGGDVPGGLALRRPGQHHRRPARLRAGLHRRRGRSVAGRHQRRRAAPSRSRSTRTATTSSPGATFSPDGDTLFVNIQGAPALTFAITGPWKGRKH